MRYALSMLVYQNKLDRMEGKQITFLITHDKERAERELESRLKANPTSRPEIKEMM